MEIIQSKKFKSKFIVRQDDKLNNTMMIKLEHNKQFVSGIRLLDLQRK